MTLAEVENHFGAHMEARSVLNWNEAGLRIEARLERRLGAVTLATGPDPSPDPIPVPVPRQSHSQPAGAGESGHHEHVVARVHVHHRARVVAAFYLFQTNCIIIAEVYFVTMNVNERAM